MGGVNGGSSELETLLRFLYVQSQKYSATAGGSTGSGGSGIAPSVQTLNFTVNVGLTSGNGSVGYLIVDYPCVIQSVTMIADQVGSINVDLLKCQFAQLPNTLSITGGSLLTINSAISSQITDLSAWTTVLQAGDNLEFRASSITNITRVSIGIKVIR